MNSISKIFFPVWPLPSASDNWVSVFHIYDDWGKEESCVDLNEMCRRQFEEENLIKTAFFGLRGRRVQRFEIPVTRGESISCMLTPGWFRPQFSGEAYRHRNVKIFLIKDPADEQVQQAAKNICDKRVDVFVLVDEFPDLSARIGSFLTFLLKYDDVLQANQGVDWPRLIIALAKSGFYFKDGFVRCNGCEYRKHARAFVKNISRSFGGPCNAEAFRFRVLRPFSRTKILCSHDDSNCYLAKEANEIKTLFTAGTTGGACKELGHYCVYYHLDTNYYLDKRMYSVPVPYNEAMEIPERQGIYTEFGVDRFLHEDKCTYLFTTTVPKKDFLTQDDLLYEGSDIKALFDKLRQNYAELTRMIDRFGKKYPVLAYGLCFPPIHGLLTTEFCKTCIKMINIIAEINDHGLLCCAKLRLHKLLDRLMTLIAQCGGVVAEKGLMCLSIEPGAKTQYEYFRYGNSARGVDELARIRRRWMELGIDYMKAVSENILSPLLDIFSPVELGHEVMNKLFGSSEIYLEYLLKHITNEDSP